MGDGRGGNDAFADTTDIDIEQRRSPASHPVVLVALLVAIAGLLYLAYRSSNSPVTDIAADDATIESEQSVDSGDAESDAEAGGISADEADDDGDGSGDTAETETDEETGGDPGDAESDVGPLNPLPAPSAGPYVSATLNLDAAPGNGMMVLTGRVPNQEIAVAVTQAAELSYAPFVESNLEIDETLDPAPWLAVAPVVIGLIPSVTDGTIMVADQRIQVAARSPNPEYLANLQGALTLLGQGTPVELVETRITDLTPPLFTARVDGETITLDGFVPSQEIIALLVGGAEAAYGAEQVTNNLTVNEETYRSFWMQTIPGVFQLFRAFPSYEFTVEDGQFSGRIQGGVNFAADSTEITAQAAQALDIGVAVLARDISIGMLVIGHTDDQGPEAYNDRLSTARSQSVIDYFIAAGIDQSRLVSAGAGESQPIADNTTPEGRAQNRRVEFTFGPPDSLRGG